MAVDAGGGRATPNIMIVLPGLSAGGSERVISTLANAWVGRGWRVAVTTFEMASTPSYYDYDPRVSLIPLEVPMGPRPLLSSLLAVARRAFRLRRAIRDFSPDLVISFLTRTNVLTLLATTGLRPPVIVSERNNPELQDVGRLWDWLRSRLYRRAFGLVTMTRGALAYFPRRMRRREWVIPNPVTLPESVSGPRGATRLTAVGRLVPQKGFDLLLDAFARVAPRFPEWNLVIWGEGPDREALERQRDRLGLSDRVAFPGVSKTPGGWMESADAFVLSSRFEGWGIVLLEAMAAGIPSVSFDCPWGPADMIRHQVDGILVPREDVPALGEAIARVLADPELRRRLGSAAQLSAKRFAPDIVVDQWNEVVLEAIGRSPVTRLPMRGLTPIRAGSLSARPSRVPPE